MATVITEECINCGACEPECPNTAIFQGGVEFELGGSKQPALSEEIFFIVPEKCTECVGFFDYEACAAVCPVDCCVPDPERPESEEVLIERAKELHPGTEFGEEFPSRFNPGRGEGAKEEPAGGGDAPAAAAPAVAAPAATAGPARDLGDFEVPVQCRSCSGEYIVAFRFFQPGTVLRCPHCGKNYTPTQRLFLSVAERLDRYADAVNAEVDRYNAVVEQAHAELDGAASEHERAAAADVRTLVLELTEPRKGTIFG